MRNHELAVTVLGAAGGIGNTIVRELHDRGHQVTAVSRRGDAPVPDGVSVAAADLADRDATMRACAGADVVVMAAQVPYPRWRTELRGLFDNALAGAIDADARLVLVDNLYAYGAPGAAITADAPEAATNRKGSLRRELAQHLLAQHRAGVARVTIGRFSDYYGGRGSSLVDQIMVGPAIAGRTVRGFIDLDQPHTFHYLADAARGFATLVERPDADGRVWVLPAAPAVTQRELIATLATVIDRPLRPGRISPAMLWMAGLFDAQLREAREVVAQFDRPYITDATAFESAFGPVEVTPHDIALQRTVATMQHSGTTDPIGPTADASPSA